MRVACVLLAKECQRLMYQTRAPWFMLTNMTTISDAPRLYTPRKFNATTKQRFYRSRRRAYAAMVGGKPDDRQKELIERITRNAWDLLRQDARLDHGELSDVAQRHRFAAENRLRLDLRDLAASVKPTAPQDAIPQAILARQAEQQRKRAA